MHAASELNSTTGTTTQEGESVANASCHQILTVQCNQKKIISTWCHYRMSLLSLSEKEQGRERGSRLSPYPFSSLFEGGGTTDDNQQLPSCMGSTRLLV